jgi:hypothetical protein
MTSNPFDDVLHGIQQVLTVAREVLSKLDAVRPEWEPIRVAMSTRGRAKRTLLAAVDHGKVRAKRVACRGGADAWFLSTHDLDQHFPLQKNSP